MINFSIIIVPIQPLAAENFVTVSDDLRIIVIEDKTTVTLCAEVLSRLNNSSDPKTTSNSR